MQNDAHDTPVYLGYASPYETEDLYRLSACFLPLGKIGGKPAWLNPAKLPKTEHVTCKSCSKPMAFMLQVYATRDEDDAHSFHRTLFIFVCRDAKCSKPNDASNLSALRCCIPRENPWYPSTGPLDADLLGPDEVPAAPADAPAQCCICGCLATKKCARCGDSWYCTKEHQVLDWVAGGHRVSCGQSVPEADKEVKNPQNAFVFPEMGMEMDREVLPASIFEDLSDSENEDDDGEESRRYNEYLKVVKSKRLEDSAGGGGGGDCKDPDEEAEEEKDRAFDRFNRILQLNKDQILRYQRGGRALVPSDKAPPLKNIAPCSLCGAPREFEMQLTPLLLSELGVDSLGESIDWAAVYIYTCSSNCDVSESGYAPELVLKHDFE